MEWINKLQLKPLVFEKHGFDLVEKAAE